MSTKNVDKSAEAVAWTATLDNRFTVTVKRTAPYRGELLVTSNGDVLHRADVGLIYDALFGPGVDDVAKWQQAALAFVDDRLDSSEPLSESQR